jgi:cytochrome c553
MFGSERTVHRILRATLGFSLGAFLLLLHGTGNAASEPRRVPDTMAQRVLPCTACHGKEGRATAEGYFPRIAGKPAGYLYNQLVNFRDGRRNYPLMVYLVEYLTDDYLRQMAKHFASIDLPYPPPQSPNVPPELLSRGEQLVRRGDASRNIPACIECHGQNLLGVEPYVPGLLGVSRDYLYGQLGFWKNGERRAHPPDCMANIASQLTPEEVRAVSAWLAAQPVAAGAKAATPFVAPLPMACGSVPK